MRFAINTVFLVLLILFLGLCGYAAIHLESYPFQQKMADNTDTFKDSVIFEIPKAQTPSTTAKILANNGFIPNAKIFLLYARLTGRDRKIRAGVYQFPSSNSIHSMLKRLVEGKMATKTVLVPEGRASWELFSLLRPFFEVDSLVLDSLIHSPNFAKSLGLPDTSLEGYLFPDTYNFSFGLKEVDLLSGMARRFQSLASSLDTNSPVYREYGLHGLMTLASIVEEEAAVVSEQGLIAGVFYNRLKMGWPLGADPTVRFIRRRLTGPIYMSELNADSPYNTRKFAGLPPGPICSPGEGAIKASLNPLSTDYMYFVAKDDGSHEHFFSVTNMQHDQYKRIAAQNRQRLGQ